MVPIHPQPCPGHPERLRWITPAGVLPFTGTPAELAALRRDGTLAAVTVEAAAVVTTLAAGRSWPAEGARVRSALHRALADPAAWAPGGAGAPPTDEPPTDEPPDDEPLRSAAASVIGGQAGLLALSHGGAIELVDVREGVVRVRMSGACHGCPAASITLRHRLAEQIRRRCPELRDVVEAKDSAGRR